jgi:hypothetical protein
MRQNLIGVCLLLALGCGRTGLLPSQPDGASTPLADPLQGAWTPDPEGHLPYPYLYVNRQMAFDDGAWETQLLGDGLPSGASREINQGTYVITDDTVELATTASSCQPFGRVTNPIATFARNGDKMTMSWRDDRSLDTQPEKIYLRLVPSLGDVGVVGCNTSWGFRPNPITPVP